MRVNRARDHDERLEAVPSDPLEAAAWWHDLVSEDGLPSAEHDAFKAWLAVDEAHARAYESVDRAWTGIEPAAADPRILEMRRDALTASARHRRAPRRVAVASFAAILGISVAAIWLTGSRTEESAQVMADAAVPSVFETGVGERSTVRLSDGSKVFLNTATRLEIDFDANVRRVHLAEGQAIFEVAHAPDRPFVVEAAGRRVTAVGTAFDVRVMNSGTPLQVTLLEGIVDVEATEPTDIATAPVPRRIVRLTPGEQLIVAETSAQEVRKVDAARTTAWRVGQLIFKNDSLEHAVAEVNRYSATKIVLASPDLGGLSVSGVFLAGKTDSFVETVAEFYGLDVTRDGDDRIRLAALD